LFLHFLHSSPRKLIIAEHRARLPERKYKIRRRHFIQEYNDDIQRRNNNIIFCLYGQLRESYASLMKNRRTKVGLRRRL
jgi:hypothetical protein